MLKEIPTAQVRDEPRRRWFADAHFDLIVWLAPDGSVDAFQLCYDLGPAEHAITWDRTRGYSHDRIDDGESSATKNRTPILVADGHFPATAVLHRFEASAAHIDAPIRSFVAEKLRVYAEGARA